MKSIIDWFYFNNKTLTNFALTFDVNWKKKSFLLSLWCIIYNNDQSLSVKDQALYIKLMV